MNTTTILALVIAANLAAMIWNTVQAVWHRRTRRSYEKLMSRTRELHTRLARNYANRELLQSFAKGWVRK